PGSSGDNGPATAADMYDPLGMVFDAAGNLYFSDNGMYRVRKKDTHGIITTIAGTGNAGYNGDNITATNAQTDLVGYMAIGPDGALYLPDYPNNRVRKIDASGIITTVAGTGVQGHSGDNGPATSANIWGPCSVLFDKGGNMYLASVYNGTVR